MRRVHGASGQMRPAQAPAPAFPDMDPTRLAAVGIGKCRAQAAGRAGHQDQVHMVGHQAPGPHRNAHLRATLGELVATGGMIVVGKEGLLPAIAALGDVMRGRPEPPLPPAGALAERGIGRGACRIRILSLELATEFLLRITRRHNVSSNQSPRINQNRPVTLLEKMVVSNYRLDSVLPSKSIV